MTRKPRKAHSKMTPQEKLAKARKKGYRDAMNDAADTVVYVMLYALRDKCDATDEQLHAFADAFRYEMDSINRGYLTVQDIKDMLADEYGDTVNMI